MPARPVARGDRAAGIVVEPSEAATAPSRGAPGATGPAIGNVWARYVLESPLGEGGMGTVWRAYDPELERRVALKVLHDDALGRAGQERLRREAVAIARVAHPSVVPVYDVGEHAGRSYYTMELVRGASLRDWLRVPRDWREVARVFGDAARGLAAIHAAGLAHRDIKPGNILLGDDGRARVADLGIALPDAPASGEGTLAGSTTLRHAGTPAYMAPEQLDGGPGGAAADQFAFGLTLWEALHGRPPFGGATIRERRAALRTAPAVHRQVPGWLDAAARRMLALDPAARFPSMDAVARALAPRRSRRGPIAVALAVGLTGAAAAVVVGTRPAAQRLDLPCVRAGTELDADWTPAIADALVARLDVGDGVAARGVATRLGARVATWRATARTACQRGARGVWSSATEGRAQACLADHAAALRGAIGAHNDAELLTGLYRVGDPARCLDPAFVAAQIVEPPDPTTAVALAGARALVATADVIVEHQRYDLARALVEHLLPTPKAGPGPACGARSRGSGAPRCAIATPRRRSRSRRRRTTRPARPATTATRSRRPRRWCTRRSTSSATASAPRAG